MNCDLDPLLTKQQVDRWTHTFGRSEQLKPEPQQQQSSSRLSAFFVISFHLLLHKNNKTHSRAQPSGRAVISHAPKKIGVITLSCLKPATKWNVLQVGNCIQSWGSSRCPVLGGLGTFNSRHYVTSWTSKTVCEKNLNLQGARVFLELNWQFFIS